MAAFNAYAGDVPNLVEGPTLLFEFEGTEAAVAEQVKVRARGRVRVRVRVTLRAMHMPHHNRAGRGQRRVLTLTLSLSLSLSLSPGLPLIPLTLTLTLTLTRPRSAPSAAQNTAGVVSSGRPRRRSGAGCGRRGTQPTTLRLRCAQGQGVS